MLWCQVPIQSHAPHSWDNRHLQSRCVQLPCLLLIIRDAACTPSLAQVLLAGHTSHSTVVFCWPNYASAKCQAAGAFSVLGTHARLCRLLSPRSRPQRAKTMPDLLRAVKSSSRLALPCRNQTQAAAALPQQVDDHHIWAEKAYPLLVLPSCT